MISFVKCSHHNLVRLSLAEFRRQANSEKGRHCPVCKREANLIQLDQSQFDRGCTQCQEPISDTPLFSEKYWALFCDGLCLAAYETRDKCRSR